MLRFFILLFLVASAALPCGANYSELGLCPNAPRQADLRPARLVGVWYEQMRYLDPGFSARCTRWHLTRGSAAAGGELKLNETRLDADDGSFYETAEILRPACDGLLKSPRFDHIMVVATDYSNHSVIQLCRQYDSFHARTVLVLTRERQPQQRRLLALLKRLENEGLRTDRLVPTPQDGCPDE